MSDDAYVCPNGHAMPGVRVVTCRTCTGSVIYEPAARGMELAVRLRVAREALGRLANPTHTPRSEEAALLQSEVALIAQAGLDRSQP